MTPGFAKQRDELPYLPYWSRDTVIINAHNFGGGAFSPAVNGKMPIAAWIPSRDTAGNGTITLTDLVGSNDGTLTNMDAATDWVADTDSGGVRALEFDGVNDYVNIPEVPFSSAVTYVAWVKPDIASPTAGVRAFISNKKTLFEQAGDDIRFFPDIDFAVVSHPDILTTNWQQVAITQSSTSYVIYHNGVSVAAGTTALLDSGAGNSEIGGFGSGRPFDGRLDDIRVWDQALTAGDVADLYAGGLGRGVDAS
jgi:hypothetical protein